MKNKYKSIIFVGLLIIVIAGIGAIYSSITEETCPYCGSNDIITLSTNNLDIVKENHRALSLIDTKKDANLINPEIARKLEEKINSFDFDKYQNTSYTLKGCQSCGNIFIMNKNGNF